MTYQFVMQVLLVFYAVGAFVVAIAVMRAMASADNTSKEVMFMASGKLNGFTNFLGNFLGILLIPAFWPLVLTARVLLK